MGLWKSLYLANVWLSSVGAYMCVKLALFFKKLATGPFVLLSFPEQHDDVYVGALRTLHRNHRYIEKSNMYVVY
jgi:hypothetical protein